VIIRTGVRSQDPKIEPGIYSNASVEWDLRNDTARTVDVVPWSAGSRGNARLLPAYKKSKAPSPRHTYDAFCYVADTDEIYMLLGANFKTKQNGTTAEAKAELEKDRGRTWAWSFAENRWKCIEDSVTRVFKNRRISAYENHLQYWPERKKILYFDSSAKQHAEFDLKTQKWTAVATKNRPKMKIYHSRTTWDSKRSLWVFRAGPQMCTFDPRERKFEDLPDIWEMKIPTDKEVVQLRKQGKKADPRLKWKGVCYVPRHDVYLVTGPTGDDTRVYHVARKKWSDVKGGKIEMRNGYCQYNPDLDLVAMNIHHDCYKFRYVPPGPGGER